MYHYFLYHLDMKCKISETSILDVEYQIPLFEKSSWVVKGFYNPDKLEVCQKNSKKDQTF